MGPDALCILAAAFLAKRVLKRLERGLLVRVLAAIPKGHNASTGCDADLQRSVTAVTRYNPAT